MSFTWPIALLGLAALPLLVLLYAYTEVRRKRSQAAFGNPALLPNVIDRSPGRLRYLPLAVLLIGLGTMIVGVARPHATVTVPREEATVILAMDVSRSMKADDVEPTRRDAQGLHLRRVLGELQPEPTRNRDQVAGCRHRFQFCCSHWCSPQFMLMSPTPGDHRAEGGLNPVQELYRPTIVNRVSN